MIDAALIFSISGAVCFVLGVWVGRHPSRPRCESRVILELESTPIWSSTSTEVTRGFRCTREDGHGGDHWGESGTFATTWTDGEAVRQ